MTETMADHNDSKPADATKSGQAASEEAAKRKTPLEMVRERQASLQAARRGGGKKGGKGGDAASGAAGADGVSKPVQIKRQMGG